MPKFMEKGQNAPENMAEDVTDKPLIGHVDVDEKSPKARARRNTTLEVVKVSFNIPVQQYKDLDNLAASRGMTMTEALRRAIASEVFLQNEHDKGFRVIIENDEGDRRQLVMSI